MLISILSSIFLSIGSAFITLIITILTGYPLVYHLVGQSKDYIRIILAYVTGFSLLVLVSILSVLIGVDPFGLQVLLVVIVSVYSIYLIIKKEFIIENTNIHKFIPFFLYITVLSGFFGYIWMWMGGDAVAHATIIRMIIDGKEIPISFPPNSVYWEIYPKGFHLYSSFFAHLTGIMPMIQSIPVIMSAIIPYFLSFLAGDKNKESNYILYLGLFCVPQIWIPLIWGGYPTIAAIMLLVAVIFTWKLHKGLAGLFFITMIVIHPREIFFVIPILGMIIINEAIPRLSKKMKVLIGLFSLSCITILSIFAIPEITNSILPFTKDISTILFQVMRWYWVILPFLGGLIALYRARETDRTSLSWLAALCMILLITYALKLTDLFPPERIIADMALPGILLGAIALFAIGEGGKNQKFHKILGFTISLFGIIGMIALFSIYAYMWAIPSEDRDAISFLDIHGNPGGILINLDETGGWVYPVTGIPVSHPRVAPGLEYNPQNVYSPPWSSEKIKDISWISEKTGNYSPVYLYISSVSRERPDYNPPFGEYAFSYPDGRITLPEDYLLIYDHGTQIYTLT